MLKRTTGNFYNNWVMKEWYIANRMMGKCSNSDILILLNRKYKKSRIVYPLNISDWINTAILV